MCHVTVIPLLSQIPEKNCKKVKILSLCEEKDYSHMYTKKRINPAFLKRKVLILSFCKEKY